MRRCMVMLGVLIVGLTGCGPAKDRKAAPAASAPKAPPAKVAGKLLVLVGSQLKLLTQEADGHLSSAPFDVPKADDYEVTDDHKTFVYRSGAVLTARNLADGSEKKLASNAATNTLCLRVAPDGRHVTFRRADDLAVVDLAGGVTVLDKVKRSSYSLGAVGSPIPATSELSCGEWLDATHVQFDRRKRMPESISVEITDTTAVVPADTTTVAVLGGKTPKLLDSPGRWHPTAACGKRIAANNGTNKDALHLRERTGDGDVTKAGAFAGPEFALAGTSGSTHYVLFVPGSCRALLYTVETRTFQTVDPATRAIGAAPIVTLPGGGTSVRVFGEPATWQPGPDAEVLATVVDKQVVLVDLHAGTTATVPADGLDAFARVVAWLP